MELSDPITRLREEKADNNVDPVAEFCGRIR